MFIAFEGPDNTGKSTSANALDYTGVATYNATKSGHEELVKASQLEPEVVVAYDRIDWFSHMVYRLALPDHEWNDERPRTVFAMPDTHLVVKVHNPDSASSIDDELYVTGKVAEANQMYFYFADFLLNLNRVRGYSLFRTVSIIEVEHDQASGRFSQRLAAFDSPAFPFGTVQEKLVHDDESLLELLRTDEQHRL